MGYPVYKLLRAVNRQYPNNGFINYVDVNEDLTNGIIDEDLRDLINEALNETYIHIAKDEVYTFPTVAGQNQYALPDDCDLRDIQEVTRTYAYKPLVPPCPPTPPPAGPVTISYYAGEGTGIMTPDEVNFGESFTIPACLFTEPEDKVFKTWVNGAGFEVYPGTVIEATHDDTLTAIWGEADDEYLVEFIISDATKGNMGSTGGGAFITAQSKNAEPGETVGDVFQESEIEVTANEGYQFSGWSLDGITTIATQFVMATLVPSQGLTYRAIFEAVPADPDEE